MDFTSSSLNKLYSSCNHSVASPTSQLILQPFFHVSYVTGSSLTSPGEPPMKWPTGLGTRSFDLNQLGAAAGSTGQTPLSSSSSSSSSSECSAQGQVLHCKRKNLGCSSAEGRSFTANSGIKAAVLQGIE